MDANKVSIIIPVFNEINTLKQLLDTVENTDFCLLKKEILLVDDGSTDGTRQLLKLFETKYKVLYHAKNMGKGAAIRTALYYATGDIIIIQDADLEYNPKDYTKLIELIITDEADVVYGSRLLEKKERKNFKFLQLLGNKFLTELTNLLFGTNLTDMETCYKAFRADVIKNIPIQSNRFDFEPEITAKVLKLNYLLKELPISYNGRAYAEGKKISWKDGFIAIVTLIKYKLFY